MTFDEVGAPARLSGGPSPATNIPVVHTLLMPIQSTAIILVQKSRPNRRAIFMKIILLIFTDKITCGDPLPALIEKNAIILRVGFFPRWVRLLQLIPFIFLLGMPFDRLVRRRKSLRERAQ